MRQTLTEEPAINTAARNAQLDIFPKSKERDNWARSGIRRLPFIPASTLLHILFYLSWVSFSLCWQRVDYICSTSWWQRCAPCWPQARWGPRWWGQSRSDAPSVLRRRRASVQRWRPAVQRCSANRAVDAATPALSPLGSCAGSTRRRAAPDWGAPRDPATPGRCTPSPGDKLCARRAQSQPPLPSPRRKVGLHISTFYLQNLPKDFLFPFSSS